MKREPMTREQRQALVDAANALQLRRAGTRVTVSGTGLDFVRVTIADRRHPFYGYSTEYSWHALQNAVARGSNELA